MGRSQSKNRADFTKDMTLLILVVIYKTEPHLSDTLQTLALQNSTVDRHVIVWDNSPLVCSCDGYAWLESAFASFEYLHTGENWPLSQIYNHTIEHYLKRQQGRFQYLILFDQDSKVDLDFIASAVEAIALHPDIGLLLPVVIANGHIVSPADLYYFKGFYWKKKRRGKIPSRFTAAINSGMVISSSYLTSFFPGYPNALAFYGTDTFLCQTYAKQERWIYVLDSTIHHDLARFREEEVDVKLWRHREATRAMRMLNKCGMVRCYACAAYAYAVSLRLAVKYMDRRFLQC